MTRCLQIVNFNQHQLSLHTQCGGQWDQKRSAASGFESATNTSYFFIFFYFLCTQSVLLFFFYSTVLIFFELSYSQHFRIRVIKLLRFRLPPQQTQLILNCSRYNFIQNIKKTRSRLAMTFFLSPRALSPRSSDLRYFTQHSPTTQILTFSSVTTPHSHKSRKSSGCRQHSTKFQKENKGEEKRHWKMRQKSFLRPQQNL